jgi:hypothetical protein
MFVFNFIFWLVGCALLAVGIWAKVDESSLSIVVDGQDITGSVSFFAYAVIVVGSIVMVLGFLGCCGAIRESQCMLATFFVFLFIIFSTLLAIGIYCYVAKPSPESLKKSYEESLHRDVLKMKESESAKENLEKARDNFHCCGSTKSDIEDAYGSEYAKEFCGKYYNTTGCAEKLAEQAQEVLNKYMVVFVGVAFGIATVMLLGMIFAMLLCCAIREQL